MPKLDAAQTLAILGTPLRWQLMQMIAASGPQSANELATALKLNFNNVSKHLRILRDAGLLEIAPGEDRRFVLYSVPEVFKRAAGELDFGFCVFRLAGAK